MGNYLSRITVTAGLAAILSLPAGAATSEWKIDPQHSSAQFSVRHMAISTVRGASARSSARSCWTTMTSPNPRRVTIDVSTVDTREPARDNDLRSDKFFDVAHFPTMTFKSKKVAQLAPGKLKVTGDLTIRGTTKEVVLDVEGRLLREGSVGHQQPRQAPRQKSTARTSRKVGMPPWTTAVWSSVTMSISLSMPK